MGDHRFSGSDQIMVFAFLTRFVEECDRNRLTEAQAFIVLPQYLTGMAEVQFRSTRYGSRSGGVTCWPEAVQYLLTKYATPSSIREAVSTMRNIRQMSGENEVEYSCRLNQTAYRCGNVFEETEKITIFVDGLIPEIRSIVGRYREETPRSLITFSNLV